jgi:hypothetical protein
MTINETYQEIAGITQEIIEKGLSVDEKWPNRSGPRISWQDQRDLSIALKNVPYADKYEVLQKDRNFNFKMVDGALVQMLYEFNANGRELQSHRLAFFPSPTLERYDSNPNAYEEQYYGDSEFHDLIEKNIVAFPIRLDFNVKPDLFTEIEHPYSHATFGEYEFCRIPVSSPLTPSIFMHFILRNFYNYAFRLKGSFCNITDFRYPTTITKLERQLLHFNIE